MPGGMTSIGRSRARWRWAAERAERLVRRRDRQATELRAAGRAKRSEELSTEERVAHLEVRLARVEAALRDHHGRLDDERLDDFLVLVAAAFESLALGSERLRFNNPR
jgi:hypothetical protein